MSTTILNEISDVLTDIERYWTNEKLAKQLIIEDLRNNDTKLISRLLSSEIINETYIQDINGYKIFDKEAFISMLRYKNYWQDSYTKYANKIGLTAEGKYLNYNSDVVLDFPFKDCILEGGMTKEDSVLKNDEKFYNQIIAKEEIDTLLAPKAFIKSKKYNNENLYDIKEIQSNDNLIIKGNNLITLYSLKKKYVNKVKMIYIDPPYNTGNDSFQYNDRFNHASWLTFMKNRIEIAKEFLSEDGIICINIDDDESHYLKVLCDDIFSRENFITNIIWQKKYTISNDARYFSDNHDHILVYAKNKNKARINGLPRNDEMNERYKNLDNDPKGKWMTQPLHAKSGNNNSFSFTFENGYTWSPPAGTFPRYGKETLKKFEIENRIWFGKNGDSIPRVKKYLSDMGNVTPSTIWLHKEFGNNDQANKEIKSLELLDNFATPKPERLLSKIISIFTNEKDLIMDFFMGSATSLAVAHKMHRQYIGIEQMDYIKTVSIPRLQKVIEGEQGGISKEVDWQGGGSFVYAELAKENQKIVDTVINCISKEELNHQIENLLNDGVLNYEVDFDKFTSTKKEFHELELEDQKEVLIRVLDNNQLYVNYSDIEDSSYNFTEIEMAFNHNFYGGV
ncbi:site-specific DNA-methyltransferase [Staphylococcus epidermidis]|uniref:DNA methyltransferase n=1 Tax=Staphylococcus epidermidis TaxID=1282 RepID=UPI0010FCE607|nr:site-specific DNA-methyltransferase [Staphylococcus epidermidis]TLP21155.1 site-specific DNA-methyltransferase [Staphylococcus epidermidis]